MPSQPRTEAVRFTDSTASLLLDLLRGLAAVLVMLSHWRALFFVDYAELPLAHRAWYAPFYVFTGAGHQAVILFFVLSGYFISGSIFRALREGRWSWSSYAVQRLARLWTVLVPGLLVCLACDAIGIRFGPVPARYFGAVSFVPDVRPSYHLLTFVGNVLFLQTLRVRMLGSDSALWSLAYEFWYYVLFPLTFLVFCPGSRVKRAGFALAAGLCAWFICGQVLPDFPVWLLGVALVVAPKPPRLSAGVRLAAGLLYLPVFFLILKVKRLPEFPGHYLLAFATLVLLWTLLSATGRAPHTASARMIYKLSKFSFTLYVVHIPMLMLTSEWLVRSDRWLPSFGHVATALAPALLTLFSAYGLALITEYRTVQVRRFAERHLGINGEKRTAPYRETAEAG